MVALEWVRVGGKAHHVSEFATLEPASRPHAVCPDCGEGVVMKLGAVRAHHVAHRANSSCAAQGGESAAHLNAKLALHQALTAGEELWVLERCPGGGGSCSERRARKWLWGWNEVAVERVVGGVRVDLLLSFPKSPPVAIEIVATHALTRQKVKRLADAGIEWIEVSAIGIYPNGLGNWRTDEPVPVLRGSHSPWLCRRCAPGRWGKWKTRGQWRCNWECTVQIIEHDGSRRRELWRVEEKVFGGRVVYAHLRADYRGILVRETSPQRSDDYPRIRRWVRREIDRLRDRGALVETPTWQRASDRFDPRSF